MTLIYASNSSGCTGKCDATCYNATQPHCDCICGGRNHGAGLKQATENTRELADEWMENWNAKHPDHKLTVTKEVSQLKMF